MKPTLVGVALATAMLTACGGKLSSQGVSANGALAGTYVMTASLSETEKSPTYVIGDNYGSFRLVLGGGHYRLWDRDPAYGHPLVTRRWSGWSSGTYALHGDRVVFAAENSLGDSPLGGPGDDPFILRWSVYHNSLTFRQLPPTARSPARAHGLDPGGPASLYVKPWRRVR